MSFFRFSDLRLEGRFPILRYFNLHADIARCDPLALIPVPGIIAVGSLGLRIAQMRIHFCFHHFLDRSAQKIFERFLYVGGALNVVFLQQPLDDVPLFLRHGLRFVVLFPLVRYNSGLLCFVSYHRRPRFSPFYRPFFTRSVYGSQGGEQGSLLAVSIHFALHQPFDVDTKLGIDLKHGGHRA